MTTTRDFPVDVRTYLIAQVAAVTSANCKIGMQTQDPDIQVSLYEIGGLTPTIAMGGNVIERHAQLQVIVRGELDGFAALRVMAHDVYNELAYLQKATLNSNVYDKIISVQEPFQLKSDENQRPMMVFNIELWWAD